ncbi:MAG: MATE family efflux transporter [Cellulosilyticaceae bacterium]
MNADYILNEKLMKVWSKFVLASVVGVVLNALYTMIDGIFVGQGTGEAGLAGVNLAWPAVTIILGVGLMLGTGASSLISIALGQKDMDYAEKILGTVLKFSLVIGGILTILGILLANPLTHLLGATEDTFAHTKDYFVVVYAMAIPYLLANTLNPLVRADGNPKLSMFMVGIGAICNIILDWLFVIVLGWGTGGAALATGAGVMLSSLVGIRYFTSSKSHIRFRKDYFKVDKSILLSIVKIGFVSLMIQLSIGIVILIQNNIIYTYGTTSDIAIFCMAGYIISLYTQLCVGISQGMQPLIGYHFGAEKFKRMRAILLITLVISVTCGIVALALLATYGRTFVQFFGISPDIRELAYTRTMIFCMGAPCIGIVYTTSAYYQALNRNIAANILSITRGCILQVGFSLLLPPIIGVEGIFYAQSLSDFTSIFVVILVLCVPLYQAKGRKCITE